MIRLHNTLGDKIEDFKPIVEGEVSMYHCGPTVYDYIHIGNLRSFYLADLLRRTFEFEGYKVNQVMNITDVGQLTSDADDGEDKMTKGLRREGKPITLEAMQELANFYADRFKEDIDKLNIKRPNHLPKASENIQEDIEIIQKLEAKGLTYKTSDGVYFDTSKISNYGALGGIGSEDESVARVETTNEKRNFKDFALWKFNESLGFLSPWGQGFPGWHIECSAMSQKFLGEHFDIHTGGMDLAPIHHNNEIAQSESACGHKTVNYWVHNEFVITGSDKMSKSLGNIITIRTIEEKGFSPMAYRYFLLTANYKTQTNFTWEALEGAQTAWNKLRNIKLELNESVGGEHLKNPSEIVLKYLDRFIEHINNDLDTPQALALVWEAVKNKELTPIELRHLLWNFDKILGLRLDEPDAPIFVTEELQKLLDERELARDTKNFEESDALRERIGELGFEVKDTENGQKLSKI